MSSYIEAYTVSLINLIQVQFIVYCSVHHGVFVVPYLALFRPRPRSVSLPVSHTSLNSLLEILV